MVGEAATALYKDAREMLTKLIDEKLISARAVFGFWPANQVHDDDIELYGDDGKPLAKLHHLRQQIIKEGLYPLNLTANDKLLAKLDEGHDLVEVVLECRAMIEPQARKRGLGMRLSASRDTGC